jgi:hypothetical protein
MDFCPASSQANGNRPATLWGRKKSPECFANGGSGFPFPRDRKIGRRAMTGTCRSGRDLRPPLHSNYKNFDLKQYGKEGRGGRTEGTFRNPNDLGVNQGLANLPYLQKIGRPINRRLREVERVSHNSGLSDDSIQRVVPPA